MTVAAMLAVVTDCSSTAEAIVACSASMRSMTSRCGGCPRRRLDVGADGGDAAPMSRVAGRLGGELLDLTRHDGEALAGLAAGLPRCRVERQRFVCSRSR
jgi:hypothetical protein